MKEIYKNFILVIVSIVVIILLLEFIFRVFLPQVTYYETKKSSPAIWQRSDYLPETFKSNAKDTHRGIYGDFNVTIEINSYGLRDYERSIASNLTRVLVLGDSMTFGYGVEMNETYSKYLERMTNKNSIKYQVFNAGGTSGDSPGTYYLYLKNYGIQKFKPRVVIIGFYYNDLSDPKRYEILQDESGLPLKIKSTYHYIDDDGKVRITKSTLPILKYEVGDRIYTFLLKNSHFFSFVKKIVTDIFFVIFRDRFYDIDLNPEIKNYWDFNKKMLLAINDLAIKNNAKLIIIIIPERKQVNDRLWEQYSIIIGEEKLDRTKPNDIVKEFGEQNNITVIDLYDTFHEKNKKMPLYLRVDGHINPQGHKVIAEEIYEYLEDSI
jgi:lysophospholipase L1-like esterase